MAMLESLPWDIIHFILSFMWCYDRVKCCTLTVGLTFDSVFYRSSQKIFTRLLLENVRMARCDRDTNERLAAQWGKRFTNYRYAHPSPIKVGSIVDAKDYLGAWGCATILEERAVTTFERPETRNFSFVPRKPNRTMTELLELGELKHGRPCYKEYHVRFHGWGVLWDEWVPMDVLARLGTYTINPWSQTCSYTKQWVLQKQKGEYTLSVVTLKSFLQNVYPPTSTLIRCLAVRRHCIQQHDLWIT